MLKIFKLKKLEFNSFMDNEDTVNFIALNTIKKKKFKYITYFCFGHRGMYLSILYFYKYGKTYSFRKFDHIYDTIGLMWTLNKVNLEPINKKSFITLNSFKKVVCYYREIMISLNLEGYIEENIFLNKIKAIENKNSLIIT